MKQLIKRILKESIKEKLQKRLEEDGLSETLKTLGLEIDELSNMIQISTEELLKEYNPFKNIFTEEEFKKELNDSIRFLTNKHFIDHLRNESLDNVLKFLISNIIDSFRDRLVDFDTEEWIIPNTPELLKMTYGDKILNHPNYITWVKTIKNR